MKTQRERESALLKSTLAYLRAMQIKAWRNNTGGIRWTRKDGRAAVTKFGLPGASDVFGILPDGRFLAIETKRPSESPTPEQWRFLLEIQRSGGVAFWASDFDHVMHWIPKILDGQWVETDQQLTQWITDESRTQEAVKPPQPQPPKKRRKPIG